MKFINSLIFKFVVLLVIVIVLLASMDNSQEVTLSFLDKQTMELPLFWWVVTAFLIGVCCTALVNTWANTKLKLKVRSVTNQANKANSTLDELRAEK